MTAADHALEAYDFRLPPELIAQEPLAERDASRLLRLDRATGAVEHRRFRELPELLRPGDLLVLNRSRVFPARLLGRRPNGGPAEILLVRRHDVGLWEALVRPGRRLRPGTLITVAPGLQARLEAEAGPRAGAPDGRPGPARLVRLLAADGDPDAAVERHGHVPLPPYIRRSDTPADRQRYQTVYAREAGSVAAPTAGLHFTPQLLDRLTARGIEAATLVLHVGPGTFRPVEVKDVREHRVDPEHYTIPEATAAAFNRARAEGRRLIAVGTTTARTLESALGDDGELHAGSGETALVIAPGHRFRVLSGLITNFHLPRSSLLLLVCAFAGRGPVLAAYQEAVRERYRFYSYGDAMLIL
ncbi:MAG: tRNA preQ1(34) S-adenosylmethionine ribosyltransferase-isomerase QueA [Betaproteobacteria bacterium]